MRNCAVLLVLLVVSMGLRGSSAELSNPRGDNIEFTGLGFGLSDPVVVTGPVFDRLDPDLTGSFPNAMGIEVIQKPWSDISSLQEGITEVRIAPAQPTSGDEVLATVSGWKSDENHVLDYANVTTAGGQVRLDFYWHDRPPIASIPPIAQTGSSLLHAQGASGGLMNAQLASVDVGPVTQYVLTPFDGTRYQVKESLGTLPAGAYTLYVTHHGPVTGSASTTFVVREAASSDGFPWSRDGGSLSWLLSP